jgi:hypothetical protein
MIAHLHRRPPATAGLIASRDTTGEAAEESTPLPRVLVALRGYFAGAARASSASSANLGDQHLRKCVFSLREAASVVSVRRVDRC